MKTAAILLSLLVLLLNGFPCCWDECSEDEVAAQTHEKSTDESCSPFLSCGGCAGFVFHEDLPETSSFTFSFHFENQSREDFLRSEYSTNIWQPPKS